MSIDPGWAQLLMTGGRVLELGCGQVKRESTSVAIDINPNSKADVIHDLNVVPYPFADSTFDVIIAEHVLEHLDDIVKVVEEIHRIGRAGGRLLVEVPFYSSYLFFTDPTHRHAFGTRSFDYFVSEEHLNQYRYSHASFRKLDVRLMSLGRRRLFRWAERWVNSNLLLYERRMAFLFPMDIIRFDLEIVK